MHTTNVKTATRGPAEQFKTDKFQYYYVIDDNEQLDSIPALFLTPTTDNIIASRLRQRLDYDGGLWSYWVAPQDVGGNAAPDEITFITT